MNKTKLLSVILLFCLLFSLCACENNDYEDDDKDEEINKISEGELYEIGLDIISVLEEMVQSEEYASLMGTSAFSSTIEEIDTGDYDSPVAVYSLKAPTTKKLMKNLGAYDDDVWNGLSENLQKQIENRLSFSTVISAINGRQGNQKLAFSASYIATEYKDDLILDETTVYLFFFESGTPVAVTFSKYKSVTAQFVFFDADMDFSEMADELEVYGFKVKKITSKK